jgi:hypothetical protein
LLVVTSDCTATEDALGSTGPPEVQIAISRDDGRRWTSVPVPVAARHGVPVAVTRRGDHVVVAVQDWATDGAQDAVHVLTLDHL